MKNFITSGPALFPADGHEATLNNVQNVKD